MSGAASLESLLEERFGLRCSEWQEERWAGLAEAWQKHGDLRRLAEEATVGETYFFRGSAQFDALVDVVLPMLARRTPDRPIRILSAGCSSGEEVYSILIALQNRRPEVPAWRYAVTGIDVNPAAIARARRATYSRWALRETPEGLRDRYFHKEGDEYRLRDEIRGRATFEERNLVADDPLFWRRGSFDVIFCRNVMIYFTNRSARALVARFADVLDPGGFLFLGYSETLAGVSDDFEPLEASGAFYHVRKALPLPALAPRRVDPVSHAAQGEMGRNALRLFHRELFDEALALLRTQGAAFLAEPRMKLLLASILYNRGDTSEAEVLSSEVALAKERKADAHYLQGLCREQEGDRAGAVEQHREAIAIDPSFALAHLRLGLLLRHLGDASGASAAFGRALALLPEEMDERILLFGGGFGRYALMGILRAEIQNRGRSL